MFVFTPKGDVLGLRNGSTAIDFAYRIHSEVGNHCNGARINDRLCVLSTTLENGDFVEILTHKSAHPSLDWLNYVATPTARNRIRQWYKKSHRQETISRGKELLEQEFGRKGIDHLLKGEAISKVAERCNLKNTDDLLAALGFGALTLNQVINRFKEEIKTQTQPPESEVSDVDLARQIGTQANLASNKSKPSQANYSPIVGLEGLDFRLGGCCSPLPGEAILGTIALGNHGITIHRTSCVNIQSIPTSRRLPVQWNSNTHIKETKFPIQLRIEVIDRVGVLKDILMRLSDRGINVIDARVKTSHGRPACIDLKVELESVNQLEITINQIRSMVDVLDIARTGVN